MILRPLSSCLALIALWAAPTYAVERETLIQDYKKVLEKFHSRSAYIGQGNPKVTRHPMTTEQCLDKAKKAGVTFENPQFQKICGAPYMAPLYNPAKEKPEDAKVCIDQFEFPNVPCEYPVVWTRAVEAADICTSIGKRICDAHEWEGACAGSLEEPDYAFDTFKDLSPENKIRQRRLAHNRVADKNAVYSYGKERKKGICGMNSIKDDGCNGGDWQRCGSNTYPVGAFPDCKSALEVFDLHGNAAEHMNLPTKAEEMASKGSKELGYTEMKGSWFIWDKYQAHPDHCRWRAPYWHGTRLRHPDSHANYHLSFRCCKDVK
jgi:formylglycine-generating enzyme required for sulfatase activity